MVCPAIHNYISLKLRRVSVGNNFRALGRIFIRGKGSITIGDNVTINSCRESNPIGGDTVTIIYAKTNSIIKIGNGVGISNTTFVAKENIEIGDDVLIGGDCKIYDHDFHSLNYEERMMHPDPGIKSAPVHIKKGAFVGAHSIILKGVTVGERSIIGAGSVVTKSIPDGEIWAGNPARFIRKI